MAPPDKRSPAPEATGGGTSKIDQAERQIVTEDSHAALDLQARKIRTQFGLTWPMAKQVAELAFAPSARRAP